MKEVPINNNGDVMVINEYDLEFASIFFANEDEELLNEQLVDADKLPGVIEALQKEQQRLEKRKRGVST